MKKCACYKYGNIECKGYEYKNDHVLFIQQNDLTIQVSGNPEPLIGHVFSYKIIMSTPWRYGGQRNVYGSGRTITDMRSQLTWIHVPKKIKYKLIYPELMNLEINSPKFEEEPKSVNIGLSIVQAGGSFSTGWVSKKWKAPIYSSFGIPYVEIRASSRFRQIARSGIFFSYTLDFYFPKLAISGYFSPKKGIKFGKIDAESEYEFIEIEDEEDYMCHLGPRMYIKCGNDAYGVGYNYPEYKDIMLHKENIIFEIRPKFR